jgi:hypothetical protein
MKIDANRIRCIDPLVSPQYPFNEPPKLSRLVVPVIPR